MKDRQHDEDIQQTLMEMRSDYWRNLEREEEGEYGLGGEEHLVVQLGTKRCALRAALCREVLKLPRLVRVPRLPTHIRGVFNLRGEIVAVTDLAPLLGAEPQSTAAGSRLVVVAAGAIKTALLVGSVEGLRRIAPDQVEALAEGAAVGMRDLFQGKAIESDGTLLLLDLEGVLARPELLIDQKRQDL